MKRIFYFTALAILAASLAVSAQEKGTDSLKSEKLDKQEKVLDDQYLKLAKDLEKVIADYKLIQLKDVRIVPFQTTYNLGSDFIEMEKHNFIKSDERPGQVVGIKTKYIKIYTNGTTVSKIESTIYEKHYYSGESDKVTIIDPSPTSGGLDDIIFTHERRGKYLVKDRKMIEIKNSMAYPVRNNLKRMFMIPHLGSFTHSLMFIAEGYYQSLKDTDEVLFDFLKSSTKY